MAETESARTRGAHRVRTGIVRAILAAYVLALGLIAFWPSHVDQGMGPFLDLVTRLFPTLTYGRIEFAANIVLFVPLGALLMLVLRHRYLIVPIAFAVTTAIESGQSLMGGARTLSFRDIVANFAGACVGMLIVAVIEWLAARVRRGAGADAAGAALRADGAGRGAEAGSRTSRE